MNKQAEPVTVKGTGKVNVFGMSLRWRGRKRTPDSVKKHRQQCDDMEADEAVPK